MSRLSYFFKRLVRMDWRAMWRTTALLKERSGKSRLWLLCDMLKCAVRYNAGYVDYKIAQMYKLTDAQRRTVITRGVSNSIVARMNDKAFWHFFDSKAEFLEELGIGQSGLDRLITACYRLLGLISFLTAGEDECRAWTIVNGTKAPQAAGKIHTDFEKGFIRAEIVPFDTLQELGSMAACREKGLVRSEGKEYVMKDGDITLFRFNV